MSKANKRKKQTVKFLKWIGKYPGWWHLICTPKDEHMNLSMMKTLIEQLAEKSFYELIFVLLMVHRDEEYMDCFNQSMLVGMLVSEWDAGNGDAIVKKLIDYFE